MNGAWGKTLFDRGLALGLLIVFAPVWLVIALLRFRHSLKLLPVARVGCGGEVFYMEQPLAPASRAAQLARCQSLLLNIWRGELSFVGPRARLPEEFDWTDPALTRHLQVRPGLLCLWWLRRRTNIAYNREWECDAEYIATPPSLTNDLGILLRALLVWCFGRPRTARHERVQLLGLQINNLTMDATLDWLLARLAVAPGGGTEAAQVSFVNADCANLAYRDAEYLRVVNGSALVLADGIGMKLAGHLLGQELKQNVNGTDLFPRLCAALAGAKTRVFLLGARPEVVAGVRAWIEQQHPALIVCGSRDGYFSPAEEPQVIADIATSRADLLLVALGAPRQEKWIARNLGQTGVKVALGVGGLFDFYSGRIPRAPLWLRELGCEWVYRLYQEPRRMWRRYLIGNLLFLWRVGRARQHQRHPSIGGYQTEP